MSGEEKSHQEKEVREIDDAERELSRLSSSIFILEIGWRVNPWVPFSLPHPPQGALASEGFIKTGEHIAPDSKDNFYKLERISVSTFSMALLIKFPYNFTCKCQPVPKGGLKVCQLKAFFEGQKKELAESSGRVRCLWEKDS